jgi:hypothetical protein
VQEERFEVSPRQVKGLTTFSVALIVVGALFDVVAFAGGVHVPLLLILGSALPLAGLIGLYAALAYRRAYTVITEGGIQTRALAGTRQAPWDHVEDISVMDPRGQGTLSVKVRLYSGKSFSLGAPVSSRIMRDPDFRSKLARIVAAWHAGSLQWRTNGG